MPANYTPRPVEDKERVYDTAISPLMAQVIAICKEHGIPMVASFVYAPEQFCTTAIPGPADDDASKRLEAARQIIQRGFAALSLAPTPAQAAKAGERGRVRVGRRILVCGGRTYVPTPEAYATLASYLLPGTTLIHGAARGADRFAAEFADGLGFVEILAFPADWERDGLAAGPIRNQRMIDEGKPDVVIAFPGGRGTGDMIQRARKAGIPVVFAQQPTNTTRGGSEHG